MYKLYSQKNKWNIVKKVSSLAGISVLVSQLILTAMFSITSLSPVVSAATSYSNDFETNTDGWLDYLGSSVVQVPSGTNGITSLSGAAHATLSEGDTITSGVYNNKKIGPFNRLGGYENDFPFGGYTVSQSVFLDMSESDGSTDKRLDISAASSAPSGDHRRDFIFHIGTNPATAGEWCVNATNNAPGNPCTSGNAAVSTSGWYTFIYDFRNIGGQLSVEMSVSDTSDTTIGSWTKTTATDIIGDTVGGHRYLWFTTNDFDGLAIDDTQLASAPPRPEIEEDVFGDTSAGYGQAGWLFNRDVNNATPIEFNEDVATLGNGSLFVEPISSTPAEKFIGEYFTGNILVEDFIGLSYDFQIAGNGDAGDANEFYTNLHANFPGNLNAYGNCKYDYVPTVGTTGAFTNFSFNATTTPNRVRGATCPATLAEMPAGSTIFFFALNLGDTNDTDTGLAGYFDKLVLTTVDEIVTYDFEPDVTAPNISWQKQPLSVYGSGSDFHVRPITSEVGTIKSVYIDSVDPANLCYTNTSDLKNMDTKNTNCQALWDNLAEGNHEFIAVFEDYSGNTTTSSSNVFAIDSSGPEVNGVTLNTQNVSLADIRSNNCDPIANFYLVNGQIDLSANLSDALSDVDGAQYKIRKVSSNGCSVSSVFSSGFINMLDADDDNEWQTVSSLFDTTTLPSDGEYTIMLRTTDIFGNTSTDYIDIEVDNEAPVISSIIYTQNTDDVEVLSGGFTNSEFFTIDLRPTDDAVRYQLKYWNDIPGSTFKESSPWSPTNLAASGFMSDNGVYIDRFSQGDGVHYFSFSACDILDNCSDFTEPFVVTYDSIAPVIGFEDVPTTDTTPELIGTVDDAEIVTVSINGGSGTVATIVDGSWQTTVLLPLAVGVYDVTVLATDAAGNQTTETFTNGLTITSPTPVPTTTAEGETLGAVTGPTTVGTPVVVASNNQNGGIGGENNNGVLSATDVAQADESAESGLSENESPQVLQSTIESTNDGDVVDDGSDTDDGCFEIFGICWYWYVIPVIAILGYGFYRYTRDDK